LTKQRGIFSLCNNFGLGLLIDFLLDGILHSEASRYNGKTICEISAWGLTGLQIRRQIRERRQYIYAKSLEAQERQTYERKQQLKEGLATGKALPTELKKSSKTLGKDLAFDEAQSGMVQFFNPG
jgi:hypothetical protein